MTKTALSEVGAAVVGTGFIGAVHVDALRRLGVQVHGVVGQGLVQPQRLLDGLVGDLGAPEDHPGP